MKKLLLMTLALMLTMMVSLTSISPNTFASTNTIQQDKQEKPEVKEAPEKKETPDKKEAPDKKEVNTPDPSKPDDGKKDDSTVTGSVYGEAQGKNKEDEKDGLEKAVDSLLKASSDGNGTPSDDALNTIIKKLEDKVKQDGTATTDDEAKKEVEKQLTDGITNGTATDSSVETLTAMQLKDNKADDAEKNVEAAIAKNPKSDKLYKVLSKVFVEKKDTESVKVYVNGKKPTFDVQPFIKSGRTMIPLRAVVESLDAKVKWNADTRTVIISKDGITIELPIDSNVITVNGQSITIDVPAQISDNRTVVPLRFISEYLKKNVHYDATTHLIVVN